jgi:hypothetical protein
VNGIDGWMQGISLFAVDVIRSFYLVGEFASPARAWSSAVQKRYPLAKRLSSVQGIASLPNISLILSSPKCLHVK